MGQRPIPERSSGKARHNDKKGDQSKVSLHFYVDKQKCRADKTH